MSCVEHAVPIIDLELSQGATWDEPEFRHETDGGTPIPVDFTGSELRMQIKISATITVVLSTLNGTLVFVDRAAGRWRLNYSSTQVALLPFGLVETEWPYDVDVYIPGSSPLITHKLMRGKITAVPGVV